MAFFLVKYLINNHLELLIQKYELDGEMVKKLVENSNNENETILEIMELIGRKRGALVSGGKVDNRKVSNIVMQDFREAKLGKITLEKV